MSSELLMRQRAAVDFGTHLPQHLETDGGQRRRHLSSHDRQSGIG